jgi:hypothetical protein
MKKSYMLIVFFLMSLNFYCQNLKKLDEKNGFREFKFGDAYGKWASQLKLLNTTNGTTSYIYNGNCCETLMGVKIEKISLDFINNKLSTISILFDEFNSKDVSHKLKEYSNIKDNIIKEYGEPTKMEVKKDEGKIDTYWEGQKTAMLFFSTYQGFEKGVTNILIITLISNYTKLNDGF